VKHYRELTSYEGELIEKLLSASFLGADVLARQLKQSRVREIDENGSLGFAVSSIEKAPVKGRVPVEAEAKDRDGMGVHVELHVLDGQLAELAFYREDSARIQEPPPVASFEVMALPP
jgi:hypothetical protein